MNDSPPDFLDPFDSAVEKTRVQSWVDTSYYVDLLSIHPGQGTITTVINHLLKNLLDESKRLGIHDFSDRERFRTLVRSFGLRSSASFTPHDAGSQATGRNDRRRAKNVRPAKSGSTHGPRSDASGDRKGGDGAEGKSAA